MRLTTANIRFLIVFFAVFFVTAVFLFSIDFVPEKPVEEVEQEAPVMQEVAYREAPTRVVIESVGVDVVVTNPPSSESTVLDQALLAGAVRHPSSALLGEQATVFLFGHQSYLPVVRNPAFKAFNGVQKLEGGERVKVYSDQAVYEYEVESVSLVDADVALIPLNSGEQRLYLSTCNSFGDPGERYVVTATFLSRTTL